MPALSKLEPLPTHELAIRLFYLYDHFRRAPVVGEFPDGKQVWLLMCMYTLRMHAFTQKTAQLHACQRCVKGITAHMRLPHRRVWCLTMQLHCISLFPGSIPVGFSWQASPLQMTQFRCC